MSSLTTGLEPECARPSNSARSGGSGFSCFALTRLSRFGEVIVAADEEQLGLVEHAGGKGVAVGKFLLQFLRGEDGGVHFAAKLLLGFACHGLIENSNPQFLHARLYRRTKVDADFRTAV